MGEEMKKINIFTLEEEENLGVQLEINIQQLLFVFVAEGVIGLHQADVHVLLKLNHLLVRQVLQVAYVRDVVSNEQTVEFLFYV